MWPIAEEINYLSKLSSIKCERFKHLIVGVKVASPDDATPTALLSYTPPSNLTWIVTLASLRSIPPVDDASLTVGDWRSYDYDASGTAKMWYTVRGNPVTSQDATYFAVVNRPCIFAFKGGDEVQLFVERGAGAVPPDEVIVIALNSYLAPAEAYDRIVGNLTQIEATFT